VVPATSMDYTCLVRSQAPWLAGELVEVMSK
jgi:hypothetical protein